HQYIETTPTGTRSTGSTFPFVRTNYKSWTKIFDLSEFQLARTNEELFKQNRNMLCSGQLQEAIDSIILKISQREKSLSNQVAGYFSFMKLDSTYLTDERIDSLADQYDPTPSTLDSTALDTAQKVSRIPDTVVAASQTITPSPE